jgi:hypothetical protein
MNANELRIGNYVNREYLNPSPSGLQICHTYCRIKSIGIEKIIYECRNKSLNKVDFDIISPIPLTEEWLVKFGFFVITAGKLIDATLPNFRFSLHKSGNYIGYLLCENDNVITNLESAHQLQNLYFALTGKELVFSTDVF